MDQYLMFIQQSAFGTGYGCTPLRMSEFPTLEFKKAGPGGRPKVCAEKILKGCNHFEAIHRSTTTIHWTSPGAWASHPAAS